MRGNAPRYTCKSNRVYLCNRSRGTIESIAVFKVTLVHVYEFHKRPEEYLNVGRTPRPPPSPDLEEKSEFPINIHPTDNRRVKNEGDGGGDGGRTHKLRQSCSDSSMSFQKDAKGGCSGVSSGFDRSFRTHRVICCPSRISSYALMFVKGYREFMEYYGWTKLCELNNGWRKFIRSFNLF